ncbi:hypothetical protein ACS5UA_19500 [Brucella sp. RRSP16]|uniref:hypothetical protein n=1 Tax=Brucella sp. RRSP16 TaxID=3453707 RepID=UPI003FCE5189
MAEIAHIALNFARDPMACLLLAILLSFLLIIPSSKIWWVHGIIAALFLTISLFFHEQRQMSLDAFLIGVFAYPAVCRDIPNQPWSIELEFTGFLRSHLSPYAATRPEISSHGPLFTPETCCLPGWFQPLQYEDDLK